MNNTNNSIIGNIRNIYGRYPFGSSEFGAGTQLPVEGCIYFDTNPPGASIYIDGVLQQINGIDVTTPVNICGLSLGHHTYDLVLPGYLSIIGDITLGAGQGQTVSTTFPYLSGICPWVTSKGGWNNLATFDIMTLVNGYLLQTNLGFTVSAAHIMGAVAYYLDNLTSGNSLTGCSFT